MVREKAQIGLKIAERRRPEKGSFDYHRAPLERWMQELPIGNIGETARMIYDALHEVNRLEISWKERQQFLELLREPVNYIQNSLVRRYTSQTFPLQEKSRRVALLAKTLYEEMALGYKTAIEEMLGSSFLTRDSRILTLLIHRAIRYLSKGLLVCYQTYTPHPGDSWFELHTLYLHAEQKNIAQAPVKDEYSTLIPRSSIARVYKQILLLALTSPYRLRQGEAEAVYSALAHWAGHAHIIPYNAPSADHALFVVHLDSDEAPDYKAFDHRDCSDELCRLVDTRQLSLVLIDELKRHENGDRHSPLGAELIYLLIRTWGITPKRNFSRSDRASNIEVVVGTTMLHRVLTHELGDPRFNIKPSSYDSKIVISVSEAHSHDIWDLFSSEKMKRNYEHYQAILKEEERKEKTSPLLKETWQVRNESAGGYRLALEQTQNAKVQVGELLGMHFREESRIWRIGV
ncbi:MAG: hypothetical protein OQK54_00075, partial [Gammaproteobacteria bacterium]|nr:hypothetical protein [Gammaproteobacteria bacterium]